MARVLVIFGTTDGQTAKVARTLGSHLQSLDHPTDVVDAAAAEPDPAAYDAVVVAASVHIGKYQREVVKWVKRHANDLNAKPTAFISLCLGVLQHDPEVDRDLRKIADAFLAATGWRPLDTLVLAGAVKYTRYNFLTRWLMKRIVGKAGGATDTSRDHEYTDWAELRQFAGTFATRLLSSTTGQASTKHREMSVAR